MDLDWAIVWGNRFPLPRPDNLLFRGDFFDHTWLGRNKHIAICQHADVMGVVSAVILPEDVSGFVDSGDFTLALNDHPVAGICRCLHRGCKRGRAEQCC